jgi:hypothetical protein
MKNWGWGSYFPWYVPICIRTHFRDEAKWLPPTDVCWWLPSHLPCPSSWNLPYTNKDTCSPNIYQYWRTNCHRHHPLAAIGARHHIQSEACHHQLALYIVFAKASHDAPFYRWAFHMNMHWLARGCIMRQVGMAKWL